MIMFECEEKLEYAKHYAKKLNDDLALRILIENTVTNSDEAKALSQFFSNMVKASIRDEKDGVELPWDDGAEFWSEKLLQTFSGYLERTGFETEWDEISDKQ
jgi:hypothetical protein